MENMLTHRCPICDSVLKYTPERMKCELCDFTFPCQINDREISEEELMQFLEDGMSPRITFTNRFNKKATVILTLNRKEQKTDWNFV